MVDGSETPHPARYPTMAAGQPIPNGKLRGVGPILNAVHHHGSIAYPLALKHHPLLSH